MVKRILLLFAVACLPAKAAELSAKDILTKNRDAIVQIFVNGMFSGTGFIISKDGLIATANHVVTTKESDNSAFFTDIKVRITRDSRDHYARPMLPVTDASKIHDVTVLKIEAAELPYVTLGDWNEVQEADTVTVVASLYGYGSHLIVTGIVSAKGEAIVKPKAPNVKTILFQAPVRGGFSGSPVFNNATGDVIGIVTTKVFGISKELEAIRQTVKRVRKVGGVNIIMNVDFAEMVADLIDTLDEDLISGLGSAVDIAYAKEMQAEIQNKKN